MRRNLSTWLVLALVGGALAGCGNSAGTPTQTIQAATTTASTATKATTTGGATGRGAITGNATSGSQSTPTAAKTTSTGTATAVGPTPGQIEQQIKALNKETAKACTQFLAGRTLRAAQKTHLEKLCKRLH
jgi:hypothetical protein